MLQLEAGKYYRTRDGRKVKIEQSLACEQYPYKGFIINGSGTLCAWLENGEWDGLSEDGRDLVAEWVDEPAPQPKPGDIVHVRMLIEYKTSGGGYAMQNVREERANYTRSRAFISPEDIVHIEFVAAPIEAGCYARYDGNKTEGKVISINDAYAWFQPVNQVEPYTVEISRLTRLPDTDK